MSRVPLAAAALAAVTVLGGCQTFIGIEDVEGHLPRLDGDYLVGLQRTRADGTTIDQLRLVGTARLDPDTRELRLALNMLNATTGATVSENAINGLVFPEDADEVGFELSIGVQDSAVVTPLTDAADDLVTAPMVLRAEGDYAFCATATGGPSTSIGSILIAPGTATPEVDRFNFVCDGL